MHRAVLLVEDSAQEKFIGALLLRLAAENKLQLAIRVRSARGGYGRVMREFEQFIRSLEQQIEPMPDIIFVAVDGNCQGYSARRNAVLARSDRYRDFVICAVPDPHVEKWFLLDSSAFKDVLGYGCVVPSEKCEKEIYKRCLNQAIIEAGVQPLLGGIEYAEELVAALDLGRAAAADASFGKLIADFRTWANRITKQK